MECPFSSCVRSVPIALRSFAMLIVVFVLCKYDVVPDVAVSIYTFHKAVLFYCFAFFVFWLWVRLLDARTVK